jgi:hypothetical protein
MLKFIKNKTIAIFYILLKNFGNILDKKFCDDLL